VETIAALNPQYLAGRTPPSAPGQRVAELSRAGTDGQGAAATKALAHAPSDLDGVVTYVVRAGDTAQTIAAGAGTSETKIRRSIAWSARVLAAGTLLLVPQRERATASSQARRTSRDRLTSAGDTPDPRANVSIGFSPGDTLAKITRTSCGHAPRAPVLERDIDENARLVSRMTLQFSSSAGGAPRARCLSEREARVLVAGDPEFFDYYEGLNARSASFVAAREGDTLAASAVAYGDDGR